MKTKQLTILAVILFIIIAIIIVANKISEQKPSEKSLAFIPNFSATNCSFVVISDSKDTVYLENKGKKWFVTNKKPNQSASPLVSDSSQKAFSEYPADSASIQTMLDKLKNMKKDELISQNPQKQSELEVDSINGTRVDVYDSKLAPVISFYIGKNSSDWSSHFVRIKGSDDVYLVGGSIKFAFFSDKSRWKDKTIVKFDKAFAKGIEVSKRDSASIILNLVKPAQGDTITKQHWEIVSPVKDSAKTTEVDKILNTLFSFYAAEIEENTSISEDSLGFKKPYLTISVTLEGGDKKTVIIGNEKGSEGKRWIRTPDKPATFLVYKYNIDNLDRSLNDLRGIEPKKEEGNQKTTKKSKKKG
jgi:hypothetical protein